MVGITLVYNTWGIMDKMFYVLIFLNFKGCLRYALYTLLIIKDKTSSGKSREDFIYREGEIL